MNYQYLWKALEELIFELKKKQITVLPELLDDLRSAHTLIKIYGTDSSALEVATDIERYLENIEANLIYLAHSDVGEEYGEDCLKRVHDARIRGLHEETKIPTTFVSGVPKGAHWIRFKISDLIDDKEVDILLEKWELLGSMQEDGYLLIHGKKENVKAFIKEVSKNIRNK
ncbi:MAG: DUF2096 family protein [Candidatus Bathyarchaeia archaeon]